MRFPGSVALLIAFSNLVMAQSVEELASLSKDTLISMAIAKISEPSFDASDFNQVEVWLEGEELTVEFSHAVKFIAKKKQFYYSITVSLVTGSPTMYIEGDGKWNEEVKFYKPSRFKNEIKFVMNAINNSNGEVGRIPEGELPDGTMTIREENAYYDISVDSESTHSYYKIKKGSGKVYDAGHKHYDHFQESTRKRIY